MSRIVLFGAGASAGSGAVSPKPPPLGSELFAVLQRLYASWRSIPVSEASAFDDDFEKGMARVMAKYSTAIAPLMQDLAVFFSSFDIQEQSENLYVSLLALTSKRADILWSSINYDCLLELAASRLNKRVAYFEEPQRAAPDSIPIWKLHGSCNFKVSQLNATRGVSFSTDVVFAGGIEPLDPGEVRQHFQGETSLYPAMAIYVDGKPILMSPNPIKDAQARWKQRVQEAKRVLVIGVRPNPSDDHIWGPLGATSASIGYVGAQPAFQKWVHTHRPVRQSQYLASTWSDAAGSSADFLLG